MGLSHDIISEFVKITNDKKEVSKEGIVYATVIQRGDYKYVKIDGPWAAGVGRRRAPKADTSGAARA